MQSHRILKRLCRLDWLLSGLLLWMFCACCFPLYDSDLFWHLKTGELILQTGEIPGFDTYTYQDYGKRWIDLHWGFQVSAAILYRLGGANLLIVSKAAILAGALAVGYFASGERLRTWQRVACWILPAITISGRGYERPEILTVLCLATWLWVIPRLERRPGLIWLLPLLQVFWINCHALYILGLVVGGCYAVDYTVRYWAQGRGRLPALMDDLPASTLIRAGILCGLAALVNPYLEQGALFPFTLLRKFTVEQDFYSARIGEFQRPIEFLWKHGFVNIYLNAEVALWVLTAASFVWLGVRRRVSVFRTLLFVAFSYLAWKASRNTNIFSIVAGFLLAANLSDSLETESVREGAPNVPPLGHPDANGHGPVSPLHRKCEWAVGALLAFMLVMVVSGEWNRRAEKIRPFRLGETRNWYPHEAARFMRRPGFPKSVFASHFGVASVYTYYNAPEGRVFMDGRLEVCSRETFARYGEISQRMIVGDTSWMQLIRNEFGGLPAIMLDTRTSRAMINGVLQTPGWRLVYADRAVAVFFEERIAEGLKLPTANGEPLLLLPEI